MPDKYQALREALGALSAETEGRSGMPWFDSRQVLREEVTGEFDPELSPIPETDMTYIATANPATIQALLAERDGLIRALSDSAMSLETIAEQAGRDEGMKKPIQIRGYAESRASVARFALSHQ